MAKLSTLQIRRYAVNGVLHYANASDPQIPKALAGIASGISPRCTISGQDRKFELQARRTLIQPREKVSPEFTTTGPNGVFYGLGPAGLCHAVRCGPTSTSPAGTNGAGATIGIINDSNVDLSLVNAYRDLFHLTSNPVQVVIDGNDPGINSDAVEAFLDVEVSGSVAPGAAVALYIASFDTLDDPLILAALRAVEDNQADVLSISFASCEVNMGAAHNQMVNEIWQQAAALGQTVFVAAGDNGAAGCDNYGFPATTALNGFAVNGLASTPWTVAVGGTDFYYSGYANGAPGAAALWDAVNGPNGGSLKAPLPEQVWNDEFGFNAAPVPALAAGSGGVSTIYSKPAWQTGSGVPGDSHRDLPDVALFAADGANLSGYVICANSGDCTTDPAGLRPGLYCRRHLGVRPGHGGHHGPRRSKVWTPGAGEFYALPTGPSTAGRFP